LHVLEGVSKRDGRPLSRLLRPSVQPIGLRLFAGNRNLLRLLQKRGQREGLLPIPVLLEQPRPTAPHADCADAEVVPRRPRPRRGGRRSHRLGERGADVEVPRQDAPIARLDPIPHPRHQVRVNAWLNTTAPDSRTKAVPPRPTITAEARTLASPRAPWSISCSRSRATSSKARTRAS